ncbi:MAG: CocE/NonD family hydrolase, partial [Proteobacteria bacterium]|nr:CocE/NonD family hydrolase [Pseudomonadota bacterium]
MSELFVRRNAITTNALVALVCVSSLIAAPLRSEAGPAAGTSVLYPGGKWTPGPARFGAEVVEDVPVTMDDGVVLNASIAYPTDPASGRRARGPFPVVVEHMPYVQFAVPVKVNPFFAEHGYISVQVRARGLGKSDGAVQFLSPREGLDGKAIIEWAAHRLQGSDGRVGLIGCSWPGAIAMTDAAAVGPGSPLKAVVAACSGMENMHRQSWLNAGLPTMSFWQFAELGPQLTGNSPAGQRFFKRFADDVLSGGDMAHDGDYWRDRGRATLARRIVDNGVPMLLWAGWGDMVETGTVRAYVALQNAHAQRPLESPMEPGQRVTPRYQLIMGGWAHGQGLDMGVLLQWMDTWIKGVDTGIQNTPTPMHVFEPGSDRWLNLTGYPLVQQYARWNLGAKGQLRPASTDAPAGRDELRFGEPGTPGAKLTYTSAPLAQGATIAGPMSVTLHASSSNTNLVFIARLYDVAPDGSAVLISRGALLGSQHRLDEVKSWRDAAGTFTWPWPLLARDAYLTPHRDYRFDLALAPRQWGVRPGHRLRLELTTQTPADRCPATGLPPLADSDPCRLTRPQEKTVPGGVYAISLGGATPSTLNLPLLSYQHFPAVRAGMLSYPWNEGQRAVGGPHAEPFALPLEWGGEGRDAGATDAVHSFATSATTA